MPYRSTEIKSYFGPASKFRHGEWYIGCQMYVVTGHAANGQLKMESGKFSDLPAAALTERHAQGIELRNGIGVPHRSPELSLRGGRKPDVAISGRQLRFRREYPVIQPGTARFPRRFTPRNDTSGWCSGAPEHFYG